jgi:hypothetical protein
MALLVLYTDDRAWQSQQRIMLERYETAVSKATRMATTYRVSERVTTEYTRASSSSVLVTAVVGVAVVVAAVVVAAVVVTAVVVTAVVVAVVVIAGVVGAAAAVVVTAVVVAAVVVAAASIFVKEFVYGFRCSNNCFLLQFPCFLFNVLSFFLSFSSTLYSYILTFTFSCLLNVFLSHPSGFLCLSLFSSVH